ncbi:hypothetical protein BpHYR1_001019 [Brachionus plicatilis]|uniref:Uncharacterized protein n=1 Tax=Brachionus plicatilis TaxID=10195 RepID=A0A3M7T849_BRAPC|nr:hypothetical protein BpHYR1_001019 [Brachionus plicatilis]
MLRILNKKRKTVIAHNLINWFETYCSTGGVLENNNNLISFEITIHRGRLGKILIGLSDFVDAKITLHLNIDLFE